MKRLMVLSFVVLACSDSQAPPMAPQLLITAGNNQSGPVGQELPQSVSARLSDKTSGAPLAGRVVNWVVLSGNGSIFAGATQTGGDGIAKQRWTLGGSVGEQRLVVRWIDPDTGEPVTIDTAKAQATPGPAVEFFAWTTGPTTLTIGEERAVEYWFEDSWNNPTTVCADGGSIDRIAWISEDATRLEILPGVSILPNGHAAVTVKAKSASTGSIAITGTPDRACSNAASAGVAFSFSS